MFHSALVGASIATLQSGIQAVMPGLGWVVGDYHHNDILLPPHTKLMPANSENAAPVKSAPAVSDDGEVNMKALADHSDILGDNDEIDDLGADLSQGIFA